MIYQNGHEMGRTKVGGRPLQTLSVDQFQWLKIGDIRQMLPVHFPPSFTFSSLLKQRGRNKLLGNTSDG
jgi:hypothetical protein